MKTIILLFSLLLSTNAFSDSGELIKITDRNSILEYTEADDVWDPGTLNRSAFETAVKHYFQSQTEVLISVDPEHILENLSDYTIEYAGIIKEGKKVIICQMLLGSWKQNISGKKHFSMVFDGGCNIVHVTYDPDEQTIISLMCNGEA